MSFRNCDQNVPSNNHEASAHLALSIPVTGPPRIVLLLVFSPLGKPNCPIGECDPVGLHYSLMLHVNSAGMANGDTEEVLLVPTSYRRISSILF